ncbi:MAG: hypothetical protein P8K77_07705 [Polaribacter sp.]|nr:hypothetical protein [Polaribacter sp.]
MEHSSINVSLTYLRGLEIAELTYEDMPKAYRLDSFLCFAKNGPLGALLKKPTLQSNVMVFCGLKP